MNQDQKQTPSKPSETTMEFKLGEVLREAGLVTSEKMDQLLKEQEKSGKDIKDILRQEVSIDSLKSLLLYEVPLPFFKNRDKKEVRNVLIESGIISDRELRKALDATDDDQQLGELLVSKGIITSEQLERARAQETASGLPLWRVLLNLRMVSHSTIADLMKSRVGIGVSHAKEDLVIDVLLNTNLVSADDVDRARKRHEEDGIPIISALISNKAVSPEKVSATLEKVLDIPFIDLNKNPPNEEMAFVIPEHVIRMHKLLPIKMKNGKLVLGMVDPLDEIAIQKARLVTGFELIPTLILANDWDKHVGKLYTSRAIAGTGSELEKKLREGTRAGALSTDDVSAVQLASSIIDGAINARATDIHLEPQIPEMRVRYRIDGLLYDVMTIPKALELPLLSRIKLLSNMDITEKRRPQDGNFSMELRNRSFNFRSASIPTYLGEKLTIRFLDESRVLTGLRQLGWETEDLRKMEALIEMPHGMILVTGPIGSGKTTTLYAALNQTNILNRNIVTIEDPVEYRLAGINQIQVNPDIGLDFRTGLRALLRHDADIMMVGEVRDSETAKVATWAALTGQLVFCTLHAKDTASAVAMMGNLGVERFLLSSSLVGVVAQRLVRKLCDTCKTLVPPSESLRRFLGWDDDPALTIGKAVGCDACFHTGFRGRTGIFELMVINPDISRMIAGGASDEEIRAAAVKGGMQTLAMNGIRKLRDAVTTPEEVLREISLA